MPEAEVVIHPESPASVIELADFVGSTSQMINFVASSNKKKFIIGTDNGLIHMMKKKLRTNNFLKLQLRVMGQRVKVARTVHGWR